MHHFRDKALRNIRGCGGIRQKPLRNAKTYIFIAFFRTIVLVTKLFLVHLDLYAIVLSSIELSHHP